MTLRLKLVIGVVVVANAITFLPTIVRHWQNIQRGRPTAERMFLRRIEPLRSELPKTGTVGYVQDDEQSLDKRRLHPAARLGLMRYAFVPLLIESDPKHALVIFDSDDPDAHPPRATEESWTLVVDRKDGIKLYRVPGESSR